MQLISVVEYISESSLKLNEKTGKLLMVPFFCSYSFIYRKKRTTLNYIYCIALYHCTCFLSISLSLSLYLLIPVYSTTKNKWYP